MYLILCVHKMQVQIIYPQFCVTGSVAKINRTYNFGISFVDTWTINTNTGEHTNDDMAVL